MRNRINALLVFAMLAATPLFAQMPRGVDNWWNSPLANGLNLTDDQRRQIRDTLREFRPKLIDVRAATEKAEAAFEDAINDDAFDQRRAADAIERLANSRADLIRAVSQMSLRMRAVLTPEQWKQLRERQENMRNRRQEMMRQGGPRRRGGDGPGGGPPAPSPE